MTLNVAHLLNWSIFVFQHNPRAHYALSSGIFVPSVHPFCGIPRLDQQRNAQFWWTIPVKRIHIELWLVVVPPLVLCSQPSVMGWAYRCHHLECSFVHSRNLRTIFWHIHSHSFIVHFYKLEMNADGETVFLPYKPNGFTNFFEVPILDKLSSSKC